MSATARPASILRPLAEDLIARQHEQGKLTARERIALLAYRELIDVYVAARNGPIDDVIDPRETRPTIVRALEMAGRRRVERPWKRQGVVPV